jgi:hypothetical protein
MISGSKMTDRQRPKFSEQSVAQPGYPLRVCHSDFHRPLTWQRLQKLQPSALDPAFAGHHSVHFLYCGVTSRGK